MIACRRRNLSTIKMTEQEQAKQESPPEVFFDYFEDMKQSELIEMLWNRMSEEERQEILLELSNKKDDDDDDDDDDDEWFDNKYPEASCHRCDKKVDGKTVVYCGGGGGACETWYCSDCHEDGTKDCKVCEQD